jgi:hypothetical protein
MRSIAFAKAGTGAQHSKFIASKLTTAETSLFLDSESVMMDHLGICVSSIDPLLFLSDDGF